jgi:hypothetical protein
VDYESRNDTIIIGAKGTISKSLRQYLGKTHHIKELQKTAILDNAHMLRKALMQKYFILEVKIILDFKLSPCSVCRV